MSIPLWEPNDKPLAIAEAQPAEAPAAENCEMCRLGCAAPLQPVFAAGGEPDAPVILCVVSPIGTTPAAILWLIHQIRKNGWQGHIVIDYCVRLQGVQKKDINTSIINHCQPFLIRTVYDMKPQSIVTFDVPSATAVAGFTVHAYVNPKSWSWFTAPWGDVKVIFAGDITSARLCPLYYGQDMTESIRQAIQPLTDDDKIGGGAVVRTASEETHDEILAWATDAPVLSIDCETYGVQHLSEFRVLQVAISRPDSLVSWVWAESDLGLPSLRALLESDLPKVGHNLNFDLTAIETGLGFKVKGQLNDTRLMYKLLNSEGRASLQDVSLMIGVGGHKTEANDYVEAEAKIVRDQLRKAGKSIKTAKAYAYAAIPDRIMTKYVARDSWVTSQLFDFLSRQLAGEPHIQAHYERIIQKAIPVFNQLERVGMGVDADKISFVRRRLKMQVDEIDAKLEQLGFNPNSPKSIREYLEAEGISTGVLTQTGAMSTGKKALGRLASKYSFASDLLVRRGLAQLLKNYANTLTGFIRSDGRVHPSYLLDGARSGRISARDPAIQQVPSRGEDAILIKGLYVAKPGNILVCLDYKTLEVFVAANLSGDKTLTSILQGGQDVHLEMAKRIGPAAWAMSPDDIQAEYDAGNKTRRTSAKCFHPETEVLTRTGWTRIVDLTVGEEVIQAIPRIGGAVDLEWVVPLEVFTKRHESGELIEFNAQGMKLGVTPDHRMLEWSNRPMTQYREVLAEDFGAGRGWSNAGRLQGPGVSVDHALLRLAVATQADGSYNGRRIRFGFSKMRKVERLTSILLDLGVIADFKLTTQGAHAYSLPFDLSARVRELLDGKSLPWSFLGLDEVCREIVVEEAEFWDGHRNQRKYRFASVDEQSVDVLQAVASITGRKTHKILQPKTDKYPKHCQMISLTVRDKGFDKSRGGNLEKYTARIPFTDEVACLSVPSTFVLVRDGRPGHQVPVITGQTVLFGTLYGQGYKALGESLHIRFDDAKKIQSAFTGSLPQLTRYIQQCAKEAYTTGSSWSQWEGHPARRRILREGGFPPRDFRRMKAERVAFNHRVQASASDYCMASVIELANLWAARPEVNIIATVHDSIVIECPERIMVDVASEAATVMTSWPSEPLKLKVDAEVGYSWGSLESLKAKT